MCVCIKGHLWYFLPIDIDFKVTWDFVTQARITGQQTSPLNHCYYHRYVTPSFLLDSGDLNLGPRGYKGSAIYTDWTVSAAVVCLRL